MILFLIVWNDEWKRSVFCQINKANLQNHGGKILGSEPHQSVSKLSKDNHYQFNHYQMFNY